MFCPKCSAILLPKEGGSVCKCGYSDKKGLKLEEKAKNQKKEVEVTVDDADQKLPVTDIDCPKCSNDKAYFWLVQTRAGDEPETKFLKCTKCKHTFRDYS
ncbi:MAG: transcription factor S [Candidatus Woesearchaeota archaeon]